MEQVKDRPRIEISDETAKGVYSNLAMIAHSKTEFVLDFVQILPGVECPKVRSRVIVTPEHAKRLLAALADNIGKYEQVFGEIRLQDEAPMTAFSSVPGEA